MAAHDALPLAPGWRALLDQAARIFHANPGDALRRGAAYHALLADAKLSAEKRRARLAEFSTGDIVAELHRRDKAGLL